MDHRDGYDSALQSQPLENIATARDRQGHAKGDQLYQQSATSQALCLFTLCGFAVAQPLFHIIGRYPEFLVAHRASPADLVILTAVSSFCLPLVLALPGALVRSFSPRLAAALHGLMVALLATIGWAQVVARTNLASLPLTVGAVLLLATATCWLYLRRASVRHVVAGLSLAALCFPLLFLLTDPVRDLLRKPVWVAGETVPATVETPIIFLVLDELPLVSLLDDSELLDRLRFPNIAALADDGVWYRNATTVAESTSYAVPAILSGRYPFADKLLPTARHYPQNLFTLLGDGYNLNVLETITRLCPRELCDGQATRHGSLARRAELLADSTAILLNLIVPEAATTGLPQLGDRWQGFWDSGSSTSSAGGRESKPKQAARDRKAWQHRRQHPREMFEQFLASLESFPPATLHYLHVLLPHAPWRYLPDGHSYPPRRNRGARRDPETGDFRWVGERWEIAQGLQRHLLQVGFVDTLLGELRSRLEVLGLYHRALIVITSDHGAAFRSGRSTRHSEPTGETVADIANVLLLIKYPGSEPQGIDDGNVETVDILPTMLTALGGAIGGLTLDGSALQQPEREPGKRLYPSWGPGSARGTALNFTVEQLDARRQALRFKQEFFPAAGWRGVFAMGPYGSLVGRAENEFEHGGEIAIELEDAEALASVDLSSLQLPLALSGEVPSGEVPADSTEALWLALLVNDRVAAVTRTIEHDGRSLFTALLSPDSLRAGRNRVRAVLVQEPPTRVSAAPSS